MGYHESSHSCCCQSDHETAGCCHGSESGAFQRHYVSPAEEKASIERYISELEHEIAGAKARLDELANR